MSLESHQENREVRQDTKQELRDLRARIDIEQSRILDRGNRAHNKRYDEKLERNDDVLIGKVDAFVERAINTDAVSPTRKVAMLQEVLGVLNNYIRGLDGVSTNKNRTADRLSGILDRFNKEITTKRIVENATDGDRDAVVRHDLADDHSHERAVERHTEVVGDARQTYRELKSKIDIEQSRILKRALREHNKRYDEKLERNDDVLMNKVDKFVEKLDDTRVISLTRKVAMLQEVLNVLNNYIRGFDGAFTSKNRTADRLSGVIDRFNKEIRTARDVTEFREGGSRPAQIITEQLPDLSESVETGREIYTVRPGDSLTKIVKDHFGIDWRTSPAASFAVVRLLNDKCRIDDTRSDPNKILAGSHLDFGKARKLLGPDGQPTVEHKDGAIAWYNSIPSTIKNGWTIEDNKNVD